MIDLLYNQTITKQNYNTIRFVNGVELLEPTLKLIAELINEYNVKIKFNEDNILQYFGAKLIVKTNWPSDEYEIYHLTHDNNVFSNTDFYHELSHVKLWLDTGEFYIELDEDVIRIANERQNKLLGLNQSLDYYCLQRKQFDIIRNIAYHVLFFPEMIENKMNPVEYLMPFDNLNHEDVLGFFHFLLGDANYVEDVISKSLLKNEPYLLRARELKIKVQSIINPKPSDIILCMLSFLIEIEYLRLPKNIRVEICGAKVKFTW
jgi:hypothetical protein